MRDAYHERLDGISDQLVAMTRLAASAIGRASTALLTADLQLAQDVIERDAHIDQLQREVEQCAYDLLARQQPVATDLRILVTSLR
ncbi:MAG: phosphate transport system regulatory protein PhoU, partial [Actinomycetota bacterium]|nr:phosphate transport system regulatory protein PhoU [Actinomycetota bacterium]